MVIQSNMTPKAITEVWEVTAEVLQKYKIPIIDKSLQDLLNDNTLQVLLVELNNKVGSTNATCIEGG